MKLSCMILTVTFAAGITTSVLAQNRGTEAINTGYDHHHGPCLSSIGQGGGNGGMGRNHGFCHKAYGAAAAEPLAAQWKLLGINPPKEELGRVQGK